MNKHLGNHVQKLGFQIGIGKLIVLGRLEKKKKNRDHQSVDASVHCDPVIDVETGNSSHVYPLWKVLVKGLQNISYEEIVVCRGTITEEWVYHGLYCIMFFINACVLGKEINTLFITILFNTNKYS